MHGEVRTRKIVYTIGAFVVVALVSLGGCSYQKDITKKAEIKQDALEVAEKYGLEDVNVTVGSKTSYGWYSTALSCSNLADLSYDQLLALADDLDQVYVSMWSLTSNGDSYDISTYTRSIYVNDEKVYDDYGNFESNDTTGWECTWCGGDGSTHDWHDEGQKCWHCGGDGWVSPDESDD